MEKGIKKLKHYIAYVKYKNDKILPMPVGGYDEKSVIKKVTDFYMDLFEDNKNVIKVVLKERDRNE
jgi:hypothetical protein